MNGYVKLTGANACGASYLRRQAVASHSVACVCLQGTKVVHQHSKLTDNVRHITLDDGGRQRKSGRPASSRTATAAPVRTEPAAVAAVYLAAWPKLLLGDCLLEQLCNCCTCGRGSRGIVSHDGSSACTTHPGVFQLWCHATELRPLIIVSKQLAAKWPWQLRML